MVIDGIYYALGLLAGGALAGYRILTMHTIAYGLTSLLWPINTKDER